jgi:hypothetical protein
LNAKSSAKRERYADVVRLQAKQADAIKPLTQGARRWYDFLPLTSAGLREPLSDICSRKSGSDDLWPAATTMTTEDATPVATLLSFSTLATPAVPEAS